MGSDGFDLSYIKSKEMRQKINLGTLRVIQCVTDNIMPRNDTNTLF
jgi:hypothetical protein